jgi:hypothetical protein
MNFDIFEVFTRAGRITWKYKVLWIFGILASCGRGSGGNSNSSGNNNNFGSQPSENPLSPQMMNQIENFGEQIGPWLEQNTWIIFVLIAFVLISVILQIFFYYVGTAGLARGVVHAENGVEKIQFGELFSESLKYFWRLFGASLLASLPFIVFFVGIIILLFLSVEIASGEGFGGVFALFFISFCCCFFPILIFFGLYLTQVHRAIIVENMKVFPAFARGWQVFTKNILGLILVGIALFVGGGILSILISLPVLLAIVPLIGSLLSGQINSWQPFILAGIFLLCYSPIAWFFNGVLLTYIESVWTLVYLRVTKPKEENNTPVLPEANA